jgi:calcium-dependent protein kinase
LKPQNILLEPDMDFHKMKIIDFGVAARFNKQPESHMTERAGTLDYVAPEVLKGKYNEKCDMWSVGVITFMLLSGNAPFFGETDEEVEECILNGKFTFSGPLWMLVSDKAKDFVRKLLTYDYNNRPSAAEALQDEWLADAQPTKLDSTLVKEALQNLLQFRAN